MTGVQTCALPIYLQPVPLIEFTVDRALTTLVVRHGEKSETYRAPDTTANFANEAAVSGQVVFAGYGISAPENARTDGQIVRTD